MVVGAAAASERPYVMRQRKSRVMRLWFPKAVAALAALACEATCVLWLWSYRYSEPTFRTVFANGGTEFGSRQGYFFWTVDEPVPMAVLNGPGSISTSVVERPLPGIEREITTLPSKSITTRVRYRLVALMSAAVFLAGMLVVLVPKYLAAVRTRHGLCAVCGYDLRASREGCPECGDGLPKRTEAA